ncbi:MAG: J domain-containing protein [Spirochaetia bacterium]|nr:J domain-containing protein [Spirochaetia bacterium]
MDQIFERLERLVKAWVNSGSSAQAPRYRDSSFKRYGDPDLDAAMAELDDYLDTSKTETERREAEAQRAQAQRERKAREEQSRRYGTQTGGEQTAAVIEQAYRYLGLKPYTPFAEVKAAYKKLLFTYHPDRNSSSPEASKKATETSTRINAAFQIIEAYEESRKGR